MTTAPPDLSALYTDPEALPPVMLDRTPLERYQLCPFGGWAVEAGFVQDVSPAADSGTEAHDVLAGGIHDYAMASADPREYWWNAMKQARPDVQPDVIEALKRCTWTMFQFLKDRNPRDIMRYQGGQGEQSGQIAWPLLPATETRGALMVTTEIDLLLAGVSEEELLEVDLKTGHTIWTAADVKASFQFNTHSWLIFNNYPAIKYLHVRIFMTRMNAWSPTVTFTRRMAMDFAGVLLQAVEYRRRMFALADKVREHDLLGDVAGGSAGWSAMVGAMDAAAKAEGFNYAWPAEKKCIQCAATQLCPCVLLPAWQLHENPVAFCEHTAAMAIAVQERLDQQQDYVEKHGNVEDVSTGFGWGCKPKKVRKPTKTDFGVYTPEATMDDPEQGDADAEP